ncbi:MAG TPA: hypothetical protein PKA63_05445 [Oligoflexia bacterium]|nr:hypothetical protein [Oligoflexia bacterium]HMP48093.1 hypothetical protein [Oligoflexia bacterium]
MSSRVEKLELAAGRVEDIEKQLKELIDEMANGQVKMLENSISNEMAEKIAAKVLDKKEPTPAPTAATAAGAKPNVAVAPSAGTTGKKLVFATNRGDIEIVVKNGHYHYASNGQPLPGGLSGQTLWVEGAKRTQVSVSELASLLGRKSSSASQPTQASATSGAPVVVRNYMSSPATCNKPGGCGNNGNQMIVSHW